MNAWKSYKDALFQKLPYLEETLNKGASPYDISAVEAKTRIQFPRQLRELYLENNGDNGEAICGMILGFKFYGLREMLSEWELWKGIIETWDEQEIANSSRYSSIPDSAVKKRYADLRWLPICGDGGGNHIGIDLDPDVNGKVGQIINFGRDEDCKYVLADSLEEFFERLTRIVNSDDFYIGEFEGEDVVFLGSDDEEEGSHLTDYLTSEDSVK